jgi:N6-adenosine-specific RNA methylase IME4
MNIERKYDIIYMDPPWNYGIVMKPNDGRPVGDPNDYPKMSISDLKEMDIKSLANKDCLIYMWVTNAFLQQGIELANHWGWDYSTVAFNWFKHASLPGFYTMQQTEICLVFKRKGGKIPQPRGTRNTKQFLSERRREASRKPDEIRRRIEEMHPTQSKLEMFARTAPEGWDVWGNETNKFTQ